MTHVELEGHPTKLGLGTRADLLDKAASELGLKGCLGGGLGLGKAGRVISSLGVGHPDSTAPKVNLKFWGGGEPGGRDGFVSH